MISRGSDCGGGKDWFLKAEGLMGLWFCGSFTSMLGGALGCWFVGTE
jgi:hypothetical protein